MQNNEAITKIVGMDPTSLEGTIKQVHALIQQLLSVEGQQNLLRKNRALDDVSILDPVDSSTAPTTGKHAERIKPADNQTLQITKDDVRWYILQMMAGVQFSMERTSEGPSSESLPATLEPLAGVCPYYNPHRPHPAPAGYYHLGVTDKQGQVILAPRTIIYSVDHIIEYFNNILAGKKNTSIWVGKFGTKISSLEEAQNKNSKNSLLHYIPLQYSPFCAGVEEARHYVQNESEPIKEALEKIHPTDKPKCDMNDALSRMLFYLNDAKEIDAAQFTVRHMEEIKRRSQTITAFFPPPVLQSLSLEIK